MGRQYLKYVSIKIVLRPISHFKFPTVKSIFNMSDFHKEVFSVLSIDPGYHR